MLARQIMPGSLLDKRLLYWNWLMDSAFSNFPRVISPWVSAIFLASWCAVIKQLWRPFFNPESLRKAGFDLMQFSATDTWCAIKSKLLAWPIIVRIWTCSPITFEHIFLVSILESTPHHAQLKLKWLYKIGKQIGHLSILCLHLHNWEVAEV